MIIILIIYSCLRISSWASRWEEEMESERYVRKNR